MSANTFDVMRLMAERNLDIRASDQILRLQKTRKGTQVTIGIAGDVVAAVADGKLVGALYLVSSDQYDQVQRELAGERCATHDLDPLHMSCVTHTPWAACPGCGVVTCQRHTHPHWRHACAERRS